MSVDNEAVKKIARLARIEISDERIPQMVGELNGILNWIEMLNEVDVDGAEPMTSVVETELPMREDKVDDGFKATDIIKNAPKSEYGFFVVPKSVE